MKEYVPSTRKAFPEPEMSMDEVTAALRHRVTESRAESALAESSVPPAVVVPEEIVGPASLRLAMQTAMLIRG